MTFRRQRDDIAEPVATSTVGATGGGPVAKFGELEAAVMDHLWSADGPVSVRAMLGLLQKHRAIAYTTVMTVMERLFRKGLLTRVEAGKAYLYSPTRSRADHTAALMADALSDSRDPGATLVRFVERVSAGDAEKLLKALSERTDARTR